MYVRERPSIWRTEREGGFCLSVCLSVLPSTFAKPLISTPTCPGQRIYILIKAGFLVFLWLHCRCPIAHRKKSPVEQYAIVIITKLPVVSPFFHSKYHLYCLLGPGKSFLPLPFQTRLTLKLFKRYCLATKEGDQEGFTHIFFSSSRT
jgi:hypothetical protein